jgi:hypothetical protein
LSFFHDIASKTILWPLQELAPATMRIPIRLLHGIVVGIPVVAGANSCNGTLDLSCVVTESLGDLRVKD